jgi:hypothetical protein
LWVTCGLGGAEAPLEVPLREGLPGDALPGDALLDDALLDDALLAATLPLVPYA